MFNTYFEDLFGSCQLHPRICCVSGGADSHDSSGAGHGQSSGSDSSDHGREADTMAGMTVTGQDLSGLSGNPSDGGGMLGMSGTDIDSMFSISDSERTTSQKVGDFITKMLVQGLSHNVITRNLQKAADMAGIDLDIEGSVASALTGIKADNPGISDDAAMTQALTTGISQSIDQGGEGATSDWLTPGIAAIYEESQINPVTGESTAPATPDVGSWDDYVTQFFGTAEGMTSAQEMLQGQADYMKEQTANWSESRGGILDSLSTATETQGSLLDDLIDQSSEGTGLFSPVKFKLAGQEVAFVPKAQRAQADQQAAFGQTGLSNASTLASNQASLADSTLANSANASPNAGGLAYLDQLQDVAKTGTTMDLARDSLTQQGDIANANLEANEPGVLDYIRGIGTLFD